MEISVVIPVYNGRRYIDKCLSSIWKQNQDMEIIVVNDGSTDGLKNYISPYIEDKKIQYIQNESRMGPAESRNKGVQAASCKYIAYLDVDDWWESDKTEKQLRLIEEGKPFVYTGRKNHNETAEKIIQCNTYTNLEILLKKNPITCSSVILEKDLAKEYPMSHSELCEDYLTWIKMMQDGIEAYGINEPLVNYTVRKDSLSGNKVKHMIKRYQTYKYSGIELPKRIYYSIYYPISKIMNR